MWPFPEAVQGTTLFGALMTQAVHVLKARHDIPDTDIKAGEPYYWWKFRFGGKHYSKTPPTRSQLTQSEFKQTLFEIEDRLSAMTEEDVDEDCLSDIISDLEQLRDDTQDKLDNMPDGLRESSSSGELLQNRLDSLETMISGLQDIDLSDMPEVPETTAETPATVSEPSQTPDVSVPPTSPPPDTQTVTDAADAADEEETPEELLQQWQEEKLGEIQGVSYDGD